MFKCYICNREKETGFQCGFCHMPVLCLDCEPTQKEIDDGILRHNLEQHSSVDLVD